MNDNNKDFEKLINSMVKNNIKNLDNKNKTNYDAIIDHLKKEKGDYFFDLLEAADNKNILDEVARLSATDNLSEQEISNKLKSLKVTGGWTGVSPEKMITGLTKKYTAISNQAKEASRAINKQKQSSIVQGNTIEQQRQKMTPQQLIVREVGVTSAIPKSTFDNSTSPEAAYYPKTMDGRVVGRYSTKSDSQNNKGHNYTLNDIKAMKNNYLVYDLETLGARGTDSFSPSQIAFRGKVNGKEVRYDSFLKMTEEAKSHFKDLITRMEDEKTFTTLSKEEKRQLLWLRDFKLGENESGELVLNASHKNTDVDINNFNFSKAVQEEIKKGFGNISDDTKNIVNLKSIKEVRQDINNINKNIGQKGGPTLVGHNISGFDNSILSEILGGRDINNFFDTMTMAKKLFKIGDINNSNGNALYGWSAEELEKFFGTKMETISKTFLNENKNNIIKQFSEGLLSNKGKGLLHSAIGDIIGEESIFNEFIDAIETKLQNGGAISSSFFEEGKTYQATGSLYRANKNEGRYLENKNKNGVVNRKQLPVDKNTWNNRLVNKKDIYTIGAYKKIKDGLWQVELTDTFGVKSLVSGTSQEDIQDKLSYALNGEGLSNSAKENITKNRAVEELFKNSNTFSKFVKGFQNGANGKKVEITSAEWSPNQKAVRDILAKDPQLSALMNDNSILEAILEQMNGLGEGITNDQAKKTVKDLFLQSVSNGLGINSKISFSPEAIKEMVLEGNLQQDFNSVKTYYRNFVNQISFGLSKERYSSIMDAINNLEPSVGEKGLYGIARIISSSLGEDLGFDLKNPQHNAINVLGQTGLKANEIINQIQQYGEQYKVRFATNATKVLYDTATNSGKNSVSGKSFFERLKKIGIERTGEAPEVNEDAKNPFEEKTLGKDLSQLEKQIKNTGDLSFNYKWTKDGNIEIDLFKGTDINSGKGASIVIPVADENGDIIHKGVKRADTLRMGVSHTGTRGDEVSFDVVSSGQEIVRTLSRALGSEDGKLIEALRNGDYEDAQSWLNWVTGRTFDSASSLETYKQLKELEGDEKEGGNEKEMWAKRSTVQFDSGLDYLINILRRSGFSENVSDEELKSYLMKYMILSTQGLGEDWLEENGSKTVVGAYLNKGYQGILKQLGNFMSSFPQAQLESEKEQGVYLKNRINLGGAKDLVAGADLNSMTKRAYTQIQHALSKIRKDLKGSGYENNIQRIVSGHKNAILNDLNTTAAIQYTLGEINDQVINKTISEELNTLNKVGIANLSDEDLKYYNELQGYLAKGGISVNEDGILITEKALTSMQGFRPENVKITARDLESYAKDPNFINFLESQGWTIEQLKDMREGDVAKFNNNSAIKKGLIWGKENSRRSLKKQEGDIFNSIKKVDGEWRIDFNRMIKSKEGVKILFENIGGRTTVNSIISNRLMQALSNAIGYEGDVDAFVQQKGLKKTDIPRVIAQYENVFEAYFKENPDATPEDLNKIISEVNPALGRYFTAYKDKEGTTRIGAFADRTRNSKRDLVDKEGNLIFEDKIQAENFLSKSISDLTTKLGVKNFPNNEQGFKILKSRGAFANEYQWTRANGSDTFGNTRNYGSLKIDDKAVKAGKRVIQANLMDSKNPKDVERALKAWYDYGFQEDDPHYQQVVKEITAYDLARSATLGKEYNIGKDNIFEVTPEMLKDFATPQGKMEGGGFEKDAYKATTYAKLMEAAQQANPNAKFLKINLGSNIELGEGKFEGSASTGKYLYVPLLEAVKGEGGLIRPRDFEKHVASIVQILNPIENAGIDQEKLQSAVTNMLVDMYNNTSFKEGSLRSDAVKKVASNAMSGTARGHNIDIEKTFNDSNSKNNLNYTDVTVNSEYLKDMLRISDDLWSAKDKDNKQSLEERRKSLSYTYRDLISEFGTDEEKQKFKETFGFEAKGSDNNQSFVTKQNQENILNHIFEILDVSGDRDLKNIGSIIGVMQRWPLINAFGLLFSNIKVDSKLLGNSISINSGQATVMNADYDSDKLYLSALLLSGKYDEYNDYVATRESMGKVVNKQGEVNKILARQRQQAYKEDQEDFKKEQEDLKSGNTTKSIEETAEFLRHGGKQDAYETIMAKTSFENVGGYSNLSTSIRQAFDEAITDRTDFVAATLIDSFQEHLEQQPISSKKIQGAMNGQFDENGKKIDDRVASANLIDQWRDFYKLYTDTSYDGKDSSSHWEKVMNKATEMGLFDDEGYFASKELQNAMAQLEVSGFGKELSELFGENYRYTKGNDDVVYYRLSKDKLPELFGLLESKVQKANGGKNLMTARYNHLDATTRAKVDGNLRVLGNYAARLRKEADLYKGINKFGDYDASYKLLEAENDFEDGKHDYIVTDSNGNSIEKVGVKQLSVTTAGNLLYPYTDFSDPTTQQIQQNGIEIWEGLKGLKDLDSIEVALQIKTLSRTKEPITYSQYLNDDNNLEHKDIIAKKIKNDIFSSERGTDLHAIFETIEKSGFLENDKIFKEDGSLDNEAFAEELKNTDIYKTTVARYQDLNAKYNKIFGRTLFGENDYKDIIDIANLYAQHREDFAKMGDVALLAEQPTAMDMEMGKEHGNGVLRLVGTADGFTEKGVTDYKIKEHVNGLLESWQLNALWRNKKLQMNNDLQAIAKSFGISVNDTDKLIELLGDENFWNNKELKDYMSDNSRSQIMKQMSSNGNLSDYQKMLLSYVKGEAPLLTIKQFFQDKNKLWNLATWTFGEMDDATFESLASLAYDGADSEWGVSRANIKQLLEIADINTKKKGQAWNIKGESVDPNDPTNLMYGVESAPAADFIYRSLSSKEQNKLKKDENFLSLHGLSIDKIKEIKETDENTFKKFNKVLDRIAKGIGSQSDYNFMQDYLSENATDEQRKLMTYRTKQESLEDLKQQFKEAKESTPIYDYYDKVYGEVVENAQDKINRDIQKQAQLAQGKTEEEAEAEANKILGGEKEFKESAYYGILDENGKEQEYIPENQKGTATSVLTGLPHEVVATLNKFRHTHEKVSLPTKEDMDVLKQVIDIQKKENGGEVKLKEFGIDFLNGESLTIDIEKLQKVIEQWLNSTPNKNKTAEDFWKALKDKLPSAADSEEFEQEFKKWKKENKDGTRNDFLREKMQEELGEGVLDKDSQFFLFGDTTEKEVVREVSAAVRNMSTPLQSHNVLEALKEAKEETKANPTFENIRKDENVNASNEGLQALATYWDMQDEQGNKVVQEAYQQLREAQKAYNDNLAKEKAYVEDVNKSPKVKEQKDANKILNSYINKDYLSGINKNNVAMFANKLFFANNSTHASIPTKFGEMMLSLGIDSKDLTNLLEKSFTGKKGKRFNLDSFKKTIQKKIQSKMESYNSAISTIDEAIQEIENKIIKQGNNPTLEGQLQQLKEQKEATQKSKLQIKEANDNLSNTVNKYIQTDSNTFQYNKALLEAVDLQKKINKIQQGKSEDLNTEERNDIKKRYVNALGNVESYGNELGVFDDTVDSKKQAKKLVEKMAKEEDKAITKNYNANIQNAISEIKELQKLLGSDVEPKYINALNEGLSEIIGTGEKAKKVVKDIVSTMSEKDKMSFLISQEQNYTNSLAQLRTIDNREQNLELMRSTGGFLNRPKTNVFNPYQDKMMASMSNQLGIQKAAIQTNLQAQKDLFKGDENETKRLENMDAFNSKLMLLNRNFVKTQQDAIKGSVGLEQFGASVKNMLGTAFQYGIVYRGAQSLIQSVFSLVSAVQQFNTINTQLRMTADVSKSTATSMIKDYRDIADEYGVMTAEIASGSVDILRQGRSVEDTNTMMRQSAILSKVGFMEQKEAIELLTATINGFNLEAKDCADIVDLVSYTDTIAATSAQELMTAFQYVASSANVAGFSVEELNAMVATVSETTRLSASTIGQAFKTMVSRLQQVKVGSFVDEETGETISNVDKVLKQYGIDILDVTGKMKDGDEILKELHKEWNSWGDDVAKKREVVEAIAGTRQGNMAMALMDNWDRYEEIFNDVENNASGSAASKMAANNESLEASIARLKNSLSDVSSSGWATGFYKWVVDLTTGFADLKMVILPVTGLFLLLKKNGAGANAIFNTQIGILTKLGNLWGRIKDPIGFRQEQAIQNMTNSRMDVLNGGGLSALIDPVTGQASEPMFSGKAINILNNKYRSDFSTAMNNVGMDETEIENFVKSGGIQSHKGLMVAMTREGISNNAQSMIKNAQSFIDANVLNGSIGHEDYAILEKGLNSIFNRGVNDTQLNTDLNTIFTRDQKTGELKLAGNWKQNVENYNKEAELYKKEHPEDFNHEVDIQVDAMQQLTQEIVKLTNVVSENNIKLEQQNKLKDLEEKRKNNAISQEDYETEKAKINKNAEDNLSKIRNEETPIKSNNNNKSTTLYKVEEGQEDFSAPTTNSSKKQSKTGFGKLMQGSWQDRKLGTMGKTGVSLGSMAIMGFGTYGASGLLEKSGMSSSASSMLGLGAGSILSGVAGMGPWGMLASGGISAILAITNAYKEHQEKVKKKIRETAQEAQEAFKNINKSIEELSDSDFQTKFKSLSQGVDEKGQNISLSEDDYKEYRSMVDSILEKTPELVKTYTAEHEAIIDRNSILEDSIKLLKEENEEKRKAMYSDEATNVAVEDIEKERKERLQQTNRSYFKEQNDLETKFVAGPVPITLTQEGDYYGLSEEEIAEKHKTSYETSLQQVKDRLNYLQQNKPKDTKAIFTEVGGVVYNYEDYLKMVEEQLSTGERLVDSYNKNRTENAKYNKESNQKTAREFLNNLTIQEGYNNLSTESQSALGNYINTLDYSSYGDLTKEKNRDKVKTDIQEALEIMSNNVLNRLVTDFSQDSVSMNSSELSKKRKEILEQILILSDNDEEKALKLAKGFGVVETNYQGNYNGANNYNETENALRDKFSKDNILQKTGNSNVFSDLSQQQKIDLNNHWDEIIPYLRKEIEALEDNTKVTEVLKNAIDEQNKKNYEKEDITETIDNEQLNKRTKGISDFLSVVKNYRENTYLDSNGSLQNVMDPETLQGIKNFKTTFNLSEEQMNNAFQRDKNGNYNLGDDSVQKALSYAVQNTFGGGKLLGIDDIEAQLQNFEALGIHGARTSAYAGFLTSLAQNPEQENKLNSSQKKTLEAANNTIKEQIKDSLEDIKTSINPSQMAEEIKDYYSTILNGKSVEDFVNELNTATSALGGFSSVVNSLAGEITKGTPGLEAETIYNAIKSGDYEGLRNSMATTFNAPEYLEMDSSEIATVSIAGLKQAKAQKDIEIKSLEDQIITATNGMTEKEKKEANKQLSSLNRQLKQTQKNLKELEDQAKLDKLNLGINKVKLTFDSLAKSIETVNTAIGLLSSDDYTSKVSYINEELALSQEYSEASTKEWERLLQEYEQADTGETIQAIGEALSEVSDNMTSQLAKQIELKNQLGEELGSALDANISNLTDTVNRELNILRLQKENIQPEKLNYFNADAITAPSVMLGNVNKDNVTKAREETRKLIEEERDRQTKINEIKEDALNRIYQKAEQDRADEKEEIEANIKDIEDQIKEMQDRISNKVNESTIQGLETALSAAKQWRDTVQGYIDNFDFSNFNQINGQRLSQTDFKNGGKFGNDYTGYDRDKETSNPINEAMIGYGVGSHNMYKSGKKSISEEDLTALDNALEGTKIASHGSDEAKDWGVYIKGKGYGFQDEQGNYTYWTREDILKTGVWGNKGDNKIYKKNPQPNAYSTSYDPISNGPITVGEHHPEFVMFKNGEGAIFDKTTILNGNEVDFVTDASYANNGKNNGVSVVEKGDFRPAYANGGNEKAIDKIHISDSHIVREKESVEEINKKVVDNIEETNDSISSNIKNTNEDIVSNIEESDEEINVNVTDTTAILLQNISSTNALIEKAIQSSNNNNTNNIISSLNLNEKNIIGFFNNVTKITTEGFNLIANQFGDFIQKLKNSVPDISSSNNSGGSNSIVQAALKEWTSFGNRSLGNSNKYNNYNNSPWCGYFVDYVAKEAGMTGLPSQVSVFNGMNSMKKLGNYHDKGTYIPQAGDLVYFTGASNKGHIGIVEAYDSTSNMVYTIEGNSSNGIYKRSYKNDSKQIIGYGSTAPFVKQYDKGIGVSNNKDLSHYGTMSEKQGEYKVDKKTGEWIYEPYETVVDTSKYDVISSEKSQKIRENKHDSGTVEAMDIAYYIKQKYPEITSQGIAAILGNIKQESDFNPKAKTVEAYGSGSNKQIARLGLFQLDDSRISNWSNIVNNGTWQQQIDTALAEGRYDNSGMGNSSKYNVWDNVLTNTSLNASEAAKLWDELYERSDGKSRDIRATNAEEYLQQIEEANFNLQSNTTALEGNTKAIKEKTPEEKAIEDIEKIVASPKFVSDTFRKNLAEDYVIKQQENNFIQYLHENIPTLSSTVSRESNRIADRRARNNFENAVSISSNAISEYQKKLTELNQYYKDNASLIEGNVELYNKWKEEYDNLVSAIETQNSNIQQQVETMAQYNQKNLKMALSGIESIYISATKRMEQINAQLNMLNDWEFGEKIKNSLDLYNENRQKLLAAQNKQSVLQTTRTSKQSELVATLREAFGYSFKQLNEKDDFDSLVNQLFNADGTVNAKTLQDVQNLIEAARKAKAPLEGEQDTIESGKQYGYSDKDNLNVADTSILISDLTDIATQQAENDSDLLQLQQEAFSTLQQILSTQKENVNAINEERKSLYNAIIDNTTYLKNLTTMQGALLKETQYREISLNLVDTYNKSVNEITAYRTNQSRITTDIQQLTRTLNSYKGRSGLENSDISNWFSANGELIGDIANPQIQKLTKRWQELYAMGQGNSEEAQNINKVLASLETYGQLITEKQENQSNLQTAITQTLEQQKQLISKGQEWLEQYTTELVSQFTTNTNTNELISGYLKNIQDTLSDFNRDEQVSVIGSQLRVNKGERNNLIGEQTALKEQNNSLISSMQKIGKGISVSKLFTATGERQEFNYQQAMKEIEDMVNKGEITEGQMVSWKTNLEQVGKNFKNISELEKDIVSNYETENSLREELTKKQIESYNWQTLKMQALLELTNKRFEVENQIFDLRGELDKELRSAKQSMQWLNKSERLRIFNEEDYTQLYEAIEKMENKTSEYYNDYYNQMMNLNEETLYKQEYITNEYERRLDLVQAEYAITQKRVDLEKQQLKLKNVANERDSRVYMNGAWRQVANTEEVISASEALADAEQAYKKAQTEKRQKTQEAQMSKYIDSIKEVQDALENSTKYTNSTEEELLLRLNNSISNLIGTSEKEGSITKIVNDLSVDLHNYQQLSKQLLDTELKSSVNNLSKITDDLQEEIERQTDSIAVETAKTNKQLGAFRTELDKVDTDTLVKRLDRFSDAIDLFAQSLEDKISYNTTAYRIANDIAWSKNQWQSAWDIEDWDTMKYHENQNQQNYEELRNMGYTKLAYILEGLDGTEATEFKNKLRNTNEADWNKLFDNPEYQTAFNKGLNNVLGKNLNELAWLKKEYENGNEDTKAWAQEEAQPIRIFIRKIMSDIGESDFVALMDKMGATNRDSLAEWFLNNSESNTQQREAQWNSYNNAEVKKQQTLDILSQLIEAKRGYEYNESIGNIDLSKWSEKGESLRSILEDSAYPQIAKISKSLDEKGLLNFVKELSNKSYQDWGSFIDSWNAKEQEQIEQQKQLQEEEKTIQQDKQSFHEEQKYTTGLQQEKTDNQITQIESQVLTFGEGTDKYTLAVDEQGKVVLKYSDGTERFFKSVESFNDYVKDFNKRNTENNSLLTQALNSFAKQTALIESKNNLDTSNRSYSNNIFSNGGSSGKTEYGRYNSAGGTIILYTDGTSKNVSNKNQTGNKSYSQFIKDNKKLKKAANGAFRTDSGLYNIDENGNELVISSGRLRMMEYGDQVIPHALSENLLKWGTMNPALLNSTPERINNITNTDQSLHYSIENINLPEVKNGEDFVNSLNRYFQRTNTLKR